MKRILFSLFAFLAIGSSIQAQNMLDIIRVDDVEILPGGEATVTLRVEDPPATGLRGMQFDLYLPEGFSCVRPDETKPNITVSLASGQDPQFSISGKIIKSDPTHIRFTLMCYTDNTALIEEGDVFSFTVKADADVDVDTYGAVLGGTGGVNTNITLTVNTETGATTFKQLPYTFYLKMPIELSEEVSYVEGIGNYTDVKVVMNKRTLKADTWNTICLPFDMDATTMQKAFGEGNEITLATLTGSDYVEKDGKIKDIIIKFNTSSTTAITANTPYLIKLKNAVETFEVEGVSLSDKIVPSSVSGGDCTFYGNYDVITDLGKDEPALFISGNKFFYATGNSKLKSFRGYFTHTKLAQYIQDLSAGANISLFVDDEPTGIRNIVTTQDNDDVYDISGRKVNADKTTLQKGIYITNGKKETVH